MIIGKNLSEQFFKFILVGFYCTAVNYGIFYILLEFLSINYLISSAAGFISGVFAGYNFNKKWTFSAKKEKNLIEIIKYYTVYILSLALSLLFLKIMVDVVGINPVISNILAIGLTTCTNFVGLKVLVFNKQNN